MELANVIASLAGAALSLLAEYAPGFSPWFDKLSAVEKRLLMLGLLAGVSVVVFVLACVPAAAAVLARLGVPALACDNSGALALVEAFLSALVVNQSVFVLARRKG